MIGGVAMAAMAAACLLTGVAVAELRIAEARLPMHVDVRHGHNQSYVDRGVIVRLLPRDAEAVRYGNDRYWFSGGVWYRPVTGGFIVADAPSGAVISALPPSCTALNIGGVPYFYANDIYYAWSEGVHGFQVVVPPPGVEAAEAEPAVDDAIHPQHDQSAELQRRDRYDCSRWAADQSIDSKGTAADGRHQPDARDYQRSLSSCLNSRGYSLH